MPLPSPVVSGELIESTWGNNVVDTLVTRVGAGAYTTSQSVAAGTNPAIAFTSEVYDTHNFHAANATDLIVPPGYGGVYAITVTLTMSAAATANCLVRIVLNPGAGQSIMQNTVVIGQTVATVCYVGPLSPGAVAQATFWNAQVGAIFVGGSMEMLRVAI